MNANSPHSEASIAGETGRSVLVIANAGAGKTRLLVEHYFELLSLGFPPEGIIAFTFTEKAAGELKERILAQLPGHPHFAASSPEEIRHWKQRILQSPIGTIHQFCLRLIRESDSPEKTLHLKIIEEATELQLREQCIRRTLKGFFLQNRPEALLLLKTFGIRALQELLHEYLNHQGEASQVPPKIPKPLEKEANLLESLRVLADPIQESLAKQKRERGCLSFDDLETRALGLLRRPPPLLAKKLKFFSHVLLDEFQDTSPIQIQILEAMQGFARSSQKPLVTFFVGDPKQSIYRFRKVDINLIRETESKILAQGGIRSDSTKNFRSSPQILEFVNLFSRAAFPDSQPSIPMREQVSESAVELVRIPLEEEKMNAEDYRHAEARWVAGEIQAGLARGIPPNEIGVLFRSSGSALALLKRLKAMGIPYAIRGGQELLEKQEILDLKRLAYFFANPEDDISLIGVLRSPLFLLSDATLFSLELSAREESLWATLQKLPASEIPPAALGEKDKLAWALRALERLLRLSQSLSPSVLFRTLMEKWDLGDLYSQAYENTDCLLHLEQFLHWLERIEEENPPLHWKELKIFLSNLETQALNQAPLGDRIGAKNRVQCLTIHAAKGLEFDTVYLIGSERQPPAARSPLQQVGGQFSLRWKEKNQDVRSDRFRAIEEFQKSETQEENKRLLYVAMTRAKTRLAIPLHPEPKSKNSLQCILMEALGVDAERYMRTAPDFEPETGAVSEKKRPKLFSFLPGSHSPPASELKVTVSEMETFLACPLKHHLAYAEKIPEFPLTDPRELSPTEIGTLLHGVLKILQVEPKRPIAEILEQVLRAKTLVFEPTLFEELRQVLVSYLQSPSAQLLQATSEDLSELSFLLQLPSGKIRGQIDRLILKEGVWTLVDFKYSRGAPSVAELKAAYDFQLKTYAVASRDILEKSVQRVQVHLLAQGKAAEFSYSEVQLQEHARHLNEVLQAMGKVPLSAVQKSAACFTCSYHREPALCRVPQGIAFSPEWVGGLF